MIAGPVSPGASWFRPGVRIASIVCNATATPTKITLAHDTLERFCADHQGVNIAQGNNFSTYYDAGDMRLFFNVANQCAPNGVYLPLDACVNGFTAVTRCPADYGSEWTPGGQASNDCLGFNLYAEAKAAVDANDK
jgi:hypothetical protein